MINDNFEGKDLVILYQGKAVSVLDEAKIKDSKHIGTATVFSPVVANEVLMFKRKGGYFIDSKTKSKWNIAGWLAFHPESEIFGK